jgi:hypothetical protein
MAIWLGIVDITPIVVNFEDKPQHG